MLPTVKIRDLFAKGKPLFSFEFFPPKTDAGMANLEKTIRELVGSAPGVCVGHLWRRRLHARAHGRPW